MNQSMLTGIVIGVTVAIAGVAIANYSAKPADTVGATPTSDAAPVATAADAAGTTPPAAAAVVEPATPASIAPSVAQVIAVAAVHQTVSVPKEQCREEEIQVPKQQCFNETVTHQKPVSDENRIAGSVMGAAAGALLGKQVGGGNGKKAATLLGAVAGGYAGNQAQKSMQENDTYTTQEQRCTTIQMSEFRKVCDTVQVPQDRVVGYDVTYQIGDKTGQVRMKQKPGKEIPLKDGVLVVN